MNYYYKFRFKYFRCLASCHIPHTTLHKAMEVCYHVHFTPYCDSLERGGLEFQFIALVGAKF